jgi:hypothetical protein
VTLGKRGRYFKATGQLEKSCQEFLSIFEKIVRRGDVWILYVPESLGLSHGQAGNHLKVAHVERDDRIVDVQRSRTDE